MVAEIKKLYDNTDREIAGVGASPTPPDFPLDFGPDGFHPVPKVFVVKESEAAPFRKIKPHHVRGADCSPEYVEVRRTSNQSPAAFLGKVQTQGFCIISENRSPTPAFAPRNDPNHHENKQEECQSTTEYSWVNGFYRL